MRTPLFDEDGGAGLDAPGLDAPGLDAPGLDAPGLDAPGLDAPGLDAGSDTPALDAPPDAPSCAPDDTTCDRIDDDCDGTIDDSGACELGGGCTAFTVGGIAYQSCPAATGIAAWEGACRRIGPRYDLAVFSSGAQQDMVRDALSRLPDSDPHWVGVNDFDRSGTYVWLDRRSGLLPSFTGTSDDPAKRCAVFRTTGFYEELPCSDTRRVLCAADPIAACGGAEEGTTCNGRDDDCDGSVDEGIDCLGWSCESRTFWDHVYHACSDDRTAMEAAGDCDDMGAALAIIGHGAELAFIGPLPVGDAHIALRQASGQASPTAGWGWPDTVIDFGTPAVSGVYPWAGGEPNDRGGPEDNQENCGIVRGDALFDDRPCDERSDFLCERTWTY